MKKIEEKIKEILEIVKLCPPNLKEKCFEILLNKALGTQKEDNLELLDYPATNMVLVGEKEKI